MNTTTNEVIGKRIKKFRSDNGFTQKEFSERLWAEGFQTSHSSISNYENGKWSIPIDLLLAMCRILNINVSDVTGAILDNQSALLVKALRDAANIIEAKGVEN